MSRKRGKKQRRNKSKENPVPAAKEKKDIFKNYYLWLSLILVSGLILRIFALSSLKGTIYFDYPLLDESVYHDLAQKILSGTPFTSSRGFGLLPAYIMAFTYKIFSPDIIYIRCLNIFLGIFTCFFIFHIGKELVNHRVGLLSCLIAVLYKPFIFYNIVPLKTSLSVFLFAAAVYLFVSILNKRSWTRILLLGVTLGLMLNVRPNCILIIPLLLLCIIWKLFREKTSFKTQMAAILFFIVGISISLFPFMQKKLETTGKLRVTTGQSGYAFYLGNNLENPDPYFRPVPFASGSPFEQGTQMIIEASRREGRKLMSGEASRYWRKQVFKMAQDNPGHFILKFCRKMLVFFNRFEAGDHYNIAFMSNFAGFFKAPLLSFWLIMPLGIAGLMVSLRRYNISKYLLLIFIVYGSTLILFYTNARFRLPFLVILIPFAAVGIVNIYQNIREKNHFNAIKCSTIFILFLIISFLPVKGTDDITAYLNTHAFILNSKGLQREAITYWEKSSTQEKFFSGLADISLASVYRMQGNYKKAFDYLNKIGDNSIAAALKYEFMGDYFSRLNNYDNAVSAYKKSLNINFGRNEVRLKLIAILRRVNGEEAKREHETYKYISSFYKK